LFKKINKNNNNKKNPRIFHKKNFFFGFNTKTLPALVTQLLGEGDNFIRIFWKNTYLSSVDNA
jgi:hypothetical protein